MLDGANFWQWALAALISLALALTACTPAPVPATSPASAASPSAAGTTPTTPSPGTNPAPSATGPAGAGATITPTSPTGTRYAYACAEGKTFEMLAYPASQERATLILEGRTIELKQERSASGVRYTDGTITLIGKGLDAMIEQGGVTAYRDCKGRQP